MRIFTAWLRRLQGVRFSNLGFQGLAFGGPPARRRVQGLYGFRKFCAPWCIMAGRLLVFLALISRVSRFKGSWFKVWNVGFLRVKHRKKGGPCRKIGRLRKCSMKTCAIATVQYTTNPIP